MSIASVLLATLGVLLVVAVIASKGKESNKGIREKEGENSERFPVESPGQSNPAGVDWMAEIRQRDWEIQQLKNEIMMKELNEIRRLEGRLMEANYQIAWLKQENEDLKQKINKDSQLDKIKEVVNRL